MEKMKSDIINAAANLFKKYGLRSISIDDVCKELRISKKTFYNYFKQKDELIEEVLKMFHEQSKKKTKAPWIYDEDKNIIDVLMESDREFKNSAESEKKYFTLTYDLEKYYPNIYQKQLEVLKKHNNEVMSTLIQQGLSEKVFREDIDIDLMAEFVTTQFQSVRQLIKVKKNENLSHVFCFFRDVIIRILANEEGMKYYLEKYYNKPDMNIIKGKT